MEIKVCRSFLLEINKNIAKSFTGNIDRGVS